MSWILAFLIAVFVLDGLRLRARLAHLPVIPRASEHSRSRAEKVYRVVAAPGVAIDDAVRQSAADWARQNGLDVVDLVPGDLPAAEALALLGFVDPRTYRQTRFAGGRTAAAAMVVSPDVWARAEPSPEAASDPVAFVRLAVRLKRYACTTTDLAVAPGLRAGAVSGRVRLAQLQSAFHVATPLALMLEAAMLGVLVVGAVLPDSRYWALTAVAAYHLQPLFVLSGTSLRSRDLWRVVLARVPLQIVTCFNTTVAALQTARDDRQSARRVEYERELEGGVERFFEKRRETCPLCGSGMLSVHLRTTDLLQRKPGRFTLERCRACGHLFQNPQLSADGLRFYYKDFYDGLGGPITGWIFEFTDRAYLARARLLAPAARASRWLDVGAGHGHFCCSARDVWPATRFDAIDIGDGIDEALRRGWVDGAYRGFFTEFASSASGRYDVVSMSHYLEHTPDPRAEFDAARLALASGGHLLIEVPNPESILGRILGRCWVAFLQPQHLHLLSPSNMAALLERHGFQPVRWQYAEAHTSADFALAAVMILMQVAAPDWPWRPPVSPAYRAWRLLVWTIGAPLVGVAFLLDEALAPIARRMGASNAYRVVARKR